MITRERKRELRKLAKSKAFETGFAQDTQHEVGAVQLVRHLTTLQETRYALRFLARYHLDFSRRSRAARDRIARKGAS